MIFPVIQFARKRRKRVSDIEYLATIESGNGSGNAILRSNEGVRVGVTGDLATLTAAASKDMYLAGAACIFKIDTVAALRTATVELKVNGVIKETAHCQLSTSGAGTSTFSHHFNVKGLKVDAAQIIKLEVTVADAAIDVEGSILCIEIDDGVSPKLD